VKCEKVSCYIIFWRIIYSIGSFVWRTCNRYPHNLYPGVFAASDNPPSQSGFRIELVIAWSVIGFGVLWMCFGWIFFQKRTD